MTCEIFLEAIFIYASYYFNFIISYKIISKLFALYSNYLSNRYCVKLNIFLYCLIAVLLILSLNILILHQSFIESSIPRKAFWKTFSRVISATICLFHVYCYCVVIATVFYFSISLTFYCDWVVLFLFIFSMFCLYSIRTNSC